MYGSPLFFIAQGVPYLCIICGYSVLQKQNWIIKIDWGGQQNLNALISLLLQDAA